MRPSLKQAKYAERLSHALGQIVEYLQKGEQTWHEASWIWQDLFHIHNAWDGYLSALVSGIFWKQRRQYQEQRFYLCPSGQSIVRLGSGAKLIARTISSHILSFVPFVWKALTTHSPEIMGSDQQPIKLLRCGGWSRL
jgi:hypothetical protein